MADAKTAVRRGRPRSIADDLDVIDDAPPILGPEPHAPPLARDPVRPAARAYGPDVILGRDGKPAVRTGASIDDPLYIPDDIREPGWDLQWCRTSTTGEPDVANMVAHQENKWTPFPSERFPGRMMPDNYKGPVVRAGLMLMERDSRLSHQARSEEHNKAQALRRTQHQQLNPPMPKGYETNERETYAKRSLERSDPSLAPRRTLDIDPE